MSAPFAVLFAQVTNTISDATAASDATTPSGGPPGWTMFVYMGIIMAIVYFAMIRPQTQAKKQQEEKIKAAKTGDKVITTSGIHGVITNVKETTVIVRVADNVKLEIEKSHIDKISRPDSDSDKASTAKAS